MSLIGGEGGVHEWRDPCLLLMGVSAKLVTNYQSNQNSNTNKNSIRYLFGVIGKRDPCFFNGNAAGKWFVFFGILILR